MLIKGLTNQQLQHFLTTDIANVTIVKINKKQKQKGRKERKKKTNFQLTITSIPELLLDRQVPV